MLDSLYLHLYRRAPAYLWLLVAVTAVGRYFTLTINLTNSLPGSVFIVCKGTVPKLGDLAAFRYAGGVVYRRDTLFLKRLAGVPGSVVAAKDAGDGYRDYFLDGQLVGRAKPRSKGGIILEPGPEGVIPPGHYYMVAPNPDSLDSRYAAVGWVADSQIVGRAFNVF
ncbi:MAG: S26 family signal peptidase [Rhodocyclaceae bacterium]|nr:S26 family signal peptidase [Rhodocyclaceae bacterium]